VSRATIHSKLTKQSVEEYEAARNILWQEEAKWWQVRDELLSRQIDLRSKFRLANDLANNINIEQQIADWRWTQKEKEL